MFIDFIAYFQISASVQNNASNWFGDLIDHSFSFPMVGSLPFLLESRLLADNVSILF